MAESLGDQIRPDPRCIGSARESDLLDDLLDGGSAERPHPLPFSLLEKITKNFDERQIGRGGSAYKGQLLNDGTIVTVKKLFNFHPLERDQALHKELTELTSPHRNIVRFLGFAGSSDDLLFRISTGDNLCGSWIDRKKIIKEVCTGFKYMQMNIYEKPCNILLENLMPKISDLTLMPKITDLGLLRILCGDYNSHPSMISAVGRNISGSPCDVTFSVTASAKGGIDIKIGSLIVHVPKYLSVHHPLVQMVLFARDKFDDTFSCLKSMVPKSKDTAKRSHHRTEHGIKGGKTKISAAWVVSTAAPHHATGNCDLLSGFITEHDDQFVHALDGVTMPVRARGAVVTDAVILPDVWFVPGLTANLVSVSQLAELGYSVGFGYGECCIRSAADGKTVGDAHLQDSGGGLYVLDFLKIPLAI